MKLLEHPIMMDDWSERAKALATLPKEWDDEEKEGYLMNSAKVWAEDILLRLLRDSAVPSLLQEVSRKKRVTADEVNAMLSRYTLRPLEAWVVEFFIRNCMDKGRRYMNKLRYQGNWLYMAYSRYTREYTPEEALAFGMLGYYSMRKHIMALLFAELVSWNSN
jgi:hypothetical protein